MTQFNPQPLAVSDAIHIDDLAGISAASLKLSGVGYSGAIPPAVVSIAATRRNAAVEAWEEWRSKHASCAEKTAHAKQRANALAREIAELDSFLAVHGPDQLAMERAAANALELPSVFPEIE